MTFQPVGLCELRTNIDEGVWGRNTLQSSCRWFCYVQYSIILHSWPHCILHSTAQVVSLLSVLQLCWLWLWWWWWLSESVAGLCPKTVSFPTSRWSFHLLTWLSWINCSNNKFTWVHTRTHTHTHVCTHTHTCTRTHTHTQLCPIMYFRLCIHVYRDATLHTLVLEGMHARYAWRLLHVVLVLWLLVPLLFLCSLLFSPLLNLYVALILSIICVTAVHTQVISSSARYINQLFSTIQCRDSFQFRTCDDWSLSPCYEWHEWRWQSQCYSCHRWECIRCGYDYRW